MLKITKDMKIKMDRGFTLIELIVGIVIISILILILSLTVNPVLQIDRGKDSKRVTDIGQIANSLDAYYQDRNCYPAQATFRALLNAAPNPGGMGWTGGSMVYMQKLPFDIENGSYKYVADSATCPQWAVIFAKLTNTPRSTNTCSLSAITDCTPSLGYDEKTACVVKGSPGGTGCTQISAADIQ